MKMVSDVVSNKSYRRLTAAGYAVLILAAAIVAALLCILFTPKAVITAVIALLALAALAAVAGLLIPVDLDDAIIKQRDEAICAQDRRLLEMALSPGLGQEELDAFLDGWDIEAAPIKTVMLMAYLMKTHPGLVFPQSVAPRLGGVLTFCRFQNLKRLAHFSKVGAVYNREGIPFVILKGGAMKVYRPDFPRWMNDVDMMVPEADFERAVGLAVELGYGAPMTTGHSIDLHLPDSSEGILDIHHCLELFTDREAAFNEGLFARAKPVPMFSVDGLLPSREDMVFIACVNFYKNMAKNQTPESTLTTFFDIHYLLTSEPGFDWDTVRESARRTGTEFQVYYSVRIFDSVIPGLIPRSMLDNPGLTKAETEREAVDFLFRREVLSKAKDSFAMTGEGASMQGEWNLAVAVWVASVSLLKQLFRIPFLKTSLFKYKYLFTR